MKHFTRILCLVMIGLATSLSTKAQDVTSTIQAYLNENFQDMGLTQADVTAWTITDNYVSKHNGVRHVYISQTIGGVRVKNSTANIVIGRDGKVLFAGSRFVENLAQKVSGSTSPSITATTAVQLGSGFAGVTDGGYPQLIAKEGDHRYVFAPSGISQEDITADLVFWTTAEEDVRLAWKVSIYLKDGSHWWQIYVDANTSEELYRFDWVTSCDFPMHGSEPHAHAIGDHGHGHAEASVMPAPPQAGPGQYNVFALPVESPIHGNRSLEVSPADTTASPWGWHDTNGSTGSEYTITRGNNVYAYTDTTNNNSPDFSPDGGANLDFDFPLNLSNVPGGYKDVAVTNLFFTCNRIHDIMYSYGFDEAAGNFQFNNYGNGGNDDDHVLAEAQDGGGTNNANFATPGDGNNGRMQMYIWPSSGGGVGQLVQVNGPVVVAGNYDGYMSNFGSPLTSTPITADIALVDDGVGDVTDACTPLVNGSAINGKIAILRRGSCNFADKVLRCQDEGAIAAIIVNDAASAVISPNGTNAAITIPSLMMNYQDGEDLIAQLGLGQTVNVSLSIPQGYGWDKDGDFDNGIVIHEYGHGISTRMTGGPNNSGCLNGDEQMGEGWSDFYGIMLTMDMSVSNPVHRPMATYALEEPTTGTDGLRNAPYDTSFAVNDFTYGDISNTAVSVPHGVGFVWATMLWDLNWAFIGQYGYDANIDSGAGGNNICMQLVTDALALQPCGPGFVDGRDAILLADQINYGGAHQCLIWEVFAKRGLGASADQGSANSRSDGVEAFDIPLSCQIPTQTPTSNFTVDITSTCDGMVSFTDLSTDVPQTWDWDFGDGNTDTVQNPSHTYTADGTYTVTLTVTNTFGSDTYVETAYITVQFPEDPITTDGDGCSSDSILLTATGSGDIHWYDGQGNLLYVGNNYYAPGSAGTQTYYAENGFTYPIEFVGPADGSIGSGGNHATTFTGTVDFTADVPLVIESAWVESGAAGPRQVTLWDNFSAGGNAIQTITVDVPFTGPGRVDLGFEVPAPGNYSIGLDQADLFRNDAGANYPYVEPGLMTIVGSSAGTDFYYYFYDLEVTRRPCFSDSVAAVATVTDIIDFSYVDNGLTVDFTDLSVGATSWAWDFGDGNASTQQNPSHTYAVAGVYDVTLTTDNGTCTYTQTVNVGGVSIEDAVAPEVVVEIFPNPANDMTTISLSDALQDDVIVQLFSSDGRLILSETLNSGNMQLNLSIKDLAPAIYTVVLSGDNMKLQERLIVR